MPDLNEHFTRVIYKSISHSLFGDHALVFAFILCVGILRGRGGVSEEAWAFLLTGGGAKGQATPSPVEHQQQNPAKEWLSERSWNDIVQVNRNTTCGWQY